MACCGRATLMWLILVAVMPTLGPPILAETRLTLVISNVSNPFELGSMEDREDYVEPLATFRDFHRIAAFGSREKGTDKRRTFPEYARETGQTLRQVQSQFSPTGHFACNGHWGTGQLSGSNDVITTA